MPDAAVEDAKAVVALHEQYCRDGDVEKVMTNIAEDVVLVAADAPLIEGADAFREFYETLFSMGSWDFGHDYRGAKSSGDMVFLHGVANGKLTSGDGTVSKFANNFMHVFRAREGGKLKAWRLAFAPAPSGE